MVIQPTQAGNSVAQTYARLASSRQVLTMPSASSAAEVSISQAGRDALATSQGESDAAVAARVAEIEAKNPVNERSAEETAYIWSHDPRLIEIAEKNKKGIALTADDIDAGQKASGFLNTMAFLSPKEKQLYDEMVASGNKDAAAGLGMVAFTRATMGHRAGGAAGTTYDAINTEITASNVMKYFSQTFVDPTGHCAAQFAALADYLASHGQGESHVA